MKNIFLLPIFLILAGCSNISSKDNINVASIDSLSGKRIIKIDAKNIFRKAYETDFLDSCAPLKITRESIRDSIALEIPESGTLSTAYLFYKNKNKNKPLRTAKGNSRKLPIVDLTGLPDDSYQIQCLECGNIENIQFSIITKRK